MAARDDRKGGSSAGEASGVDRELEARFASAYDDSGVDRALIRRNLALTPAERIQGLEASLNALASLRRLEKAR